MTTLTEYAALSAFVYNDQRGGGSGSPINVLALPPEWKSLSELGFTTGTSLVENNPFSFTAGAYMNTATGEIVIAYKGTDFLLEMSGRAYNTVADLVTDAGLALVKKGVGVYNLQQLSASTYYLSVLDWAVSNGYDLTKISFTGHSLGGGLAANMAAWFDRPATTFAAAPFEVSTINPEAIIAAAATLTLQAGLTASMPVLEEINKLRRLIPWSGEYEYARRESAVTNYYNQGEMLQYLRAIFPTTVGQDLPIDIGSQSITNAVDLHSMNLHAAFLFDDRLRKLASTLPELVPELLDNKIYAADPNSRTRDFITLLVNDQIRQGLTADSALKHFSADLLKLTQYGANLKDGALGKALLDIAIADYYFMQNGFSGTDFFNAITGGIAFDLANIGTDWSNNKTVTQLDTAIISQYLGGDQTARSFLTQDNYWSIQSGADALVATGTGTNNDAMIGGTTDDLLDGAAGNDFLLGGDGADTLTGGIGYDLLEGGAGSDTYYASLGDNILDADGLGSVYRDNVKLTGGSQNGSANNFISVDSAHTYTLLGDQNAAEGATLIIDGSLTIQNYHAAVLFWRETGRHKAANDNHYQPLLAGSAA